MPIVLCRVVWAETYSKKNEDFYAGNMSYPAKKKIAHELCNFLDEGGEAYGFVQNNQNWINLTKLGAPVNATQCDGVTVVWCALDPIKRRLRVVGWYDDAVAYRRPQKPKAGLKRGTRAYQFRAKIRNAHLIPSAERFLEVPMKNRRTDKGFIGQSNWFFPELSIKYAGFLEALAMLRSGESGSPSSTKEIEVDRSAYEEGQRLVTEVLVTARNPRLVRDAKAYYGLSCQVCAFNFEECYGDIGKNFIEVHHLFQLSSSVGARDTTLNDVRVVCPNCHRMMHRKTPPYTVEELRSRLRG